MKKYSLILIALVFLSCQSDSASNDSGSQNSSAENSNGQGGSLARFTIKNNYLYTVDNQNINVFSIIDTEQPVKVNEVEIGFDIETLFSYRNNLFIGSRNGMFIYGLESPETPTFLSEAQHFTACDPVVADATHAYVTLHSDFETRCGNNLNQLQIYNVEDLQNPVLISTRNLTKPIGLGLYNDYLIVCDNEVKIFNISNPENAQLVHSINRNAFDVIIRNNLLILVGDSGVFQYSLDASNIQNVTELSTISI